MNWLQKIKNPKPDFLNKAIALDFGGDHWHDKWIALAHQQLDCFHAIISRVQQVQLRPDIKEFSLFITSITLSNACPLEIFYTSLYLTGHDYGNAQFLIFVRKALTLISGIPV